MRGVASRLWRSRFSRSVLTLLAGGAAAQTVVFLARPVLTRLYSPEAFGVLSEFVALAALLAVLATLRYEDAIPLPDPNARAGALLALCATVALGVCGVAAVALMPREAIAAQLGAPALAPLLPFVPLAALLYAWGNAAQAWLARADRYRAIAFGLGAQAVGTVALQLAAPELEAAGLVFGSVLGAVLFALALLGWALASGALVGVSPEAIVSVARRYARFPRLGLPATALGQIGARLPPLALGAMLG
ncbi:MAG: polysaccharide biosynthesis protein, partial [Bacteroidota bacterium]